MWKFLKPYVVTLLSVLCVGYFKVYLSDFLNIESPILLFFTAITISAWFGGALQGLLAIVTSILFILVYFALPDMNTPPEVWGFRLFLYFVDSGIIVFICAGLRYSKQRADASFRELKLVEKSLRHSEERLRSIFDSNMIGLVFSRFDGTINQANDYFLKILGVTRAQMEKGDVNWRTMTPGEYMVVAEESLESLERTGLSLPFEKEYVRPDGQKISVYVRAARVGVDEVVAFVLDISDRKKAEEALERSNEFLEERVSERTQQLTVANERLSTLINEAHQASEKLKESQAFLDSVIENIPNMLFVKDAKNLSFVRFNRAGAKLVGVNSEDMVGKNDYDFFPKEQADFFTQKDREVLAGLQMVEIPEETLSTPGGLRYLHTKKIPVADPQGRPLYLLGISEDITEKKNLEQQKIDFMQAQVARAEAEKTAQRLEFLSESSVSLSKSLDIQEMLSAFALTVTSNIADICLIDFFDEDTQTVERMITAFGHEAQQPDLNEWSRKNKIDSSEKADLVAEVARMGQAQIHASIDRDTFLQTVKDIHILNQFLEDQVFSLMIVPLIYRGKVFGSLTMISAGRVYGDIDLSLAQDLAKRASFAIENARLFHKAKEASRAKSAFLANISHEIRTPLGAMLGFTELAMDLQESEMQKDYLSTILKNGRQLLHIVDEVLDLSKAESDQIQVEKISFNLHKLIADIQSLLSVKASEKKLRFSFSQERDLPENVFTDPLRLRQILLNIIGNAIKFTESGGVNIHVRMEHLPNSEKLIFEINDTGIGITPEQANKLFQPFVQADNSMTLKFGGTGLGLFLARKLARLLGGDVVLKTSAGGQGSEFHISIDVSPEDMFKQLPLPLTEKEKDPPFEASEKDSRVLIVDDSEDNRELMGAYLDKSHTNFDTAENGVEGVEKAMKNDYDVILMDIQMPEMDGFEAVKYLRNKNYKKPVVAVTAHAMKGYKERCLSNGFDDYLCKPLSWSSLNECLNKFIVH